MCKKYFVVLATSGENCNYFICGWVVIYISSKQASPVNAEMAK